MQKLHVAKPINQDVTFIYWTRYEDGKQEYGGFPKWKEYHGYDILDMSPDEGLALVLDGLTWHNLLIEIEHLQDEERKTFIRLRDNLNTILDY